MKRGANYFVFTAVCMLLGVVAWPHLSSLDSSPVVQQAFNAAPEVAQAVAPEAAPEPIRDRVIDLPEDGQNWYLTLFYRDRQGDPASVRLAEHFNSNERLNLLMQQVHLNKYDPNSQMYRHRWRSVYGGPEMLPAIVLQQPDGRVCYKASGTNIPQNADSLADEIASAIADCRPRPPKPAPAPVPAPVPGPPSMVPDIRPTTPAVDESSPNVLLMVLIPLLAGGLGIYQEWKKSIGG